MWNVRTQRERSTVMMTAISRSDLRGFHKDLQEVVLMALDTGWTATRQSNGGIRLHAPDGVNTAYVPMTTKPSRNVAQTLRRKVVKHADTLRLAAVMAGSSIEQEVRLGVIPPEPPREPRQRAKVEEKPEAEDERPAATVVSERPFVAKKAPGKDGLYEGVDRATSAPRWTATPVDLVIGSHSELRAVAEVYAAQDGKTKFVQDFVKAWNKVMMRDRFDVAKR